MTNTIEALRAYQWGFEGTKAAGTLTIAEQVTADDTFTIGSKTYTIKASGAAADGELNIGIDEPATKLAIVAAINGTDGINDPHPLVTAAAFASDDCVITARLPGTAGDAIATTETFTHASNVFDASTLGAVTAGALARGTAVAATSKIAVRRLEWGDDAENMFQPQFATGGLIRNRGVPVAVQHGTRFSFSDEPMVWEQLMHWLTLALGAPVVTYVAGSPDVYRWTWTRTPNTHPQQPSVTLERLMSDGAGNTVEERAAYAMLMELALSYARNEPVRMSGNGFARRMNSNSVTAALSLPTPAIGVSPLSTVYVNDTFATVGNTLLAEQVIGWQWTHTTGLSPLDTAEGRTDLDFTKHQLDAEGVTLGFNLTALLDPTTYAAEAAKAVAGDLRAIQVKVAGSGGRSLKINGLYRHAKPSLFRVGEQDGQDIVEMSLVEATDETNFLSVILDHPTVNDLD